MLDKQGNTIAVILITTVIFGGIIFIQQSLTTSNTETYSLTGIESTVQNARLWVQEALIGSLSSTAQSGYASNPLWYCNAPTPPGNTLVKQRLQKSVNRSVNAINRSFGDQSTSLTVGSFNLSSNQTRSTLRLNGTKLRVSDEGVNLTRDLNINQSIQTRFWYMFAKLDQWVTDCDAGNIDQRLESVTDGTCSFKRCRCANPSINPYVDDIKENHGIEPNDVQNAITSSMSSLESVMSGSPTCGGTGSVSGITCEVRIKNVTTNNEANTQPLNKCQITATDYVEAGDTSTLGRNETLDCPSRPQTTTHYPPEETQKPSPYNNTGGPRSGTMLALDKQAKGTYTVTCRDKGNNQVKPLEASIDLEFSVERACEYPSVNASENLCAPNGGGSGPGGGGPGGGGPGPCAIANVTCGDGIVEVNGTECMPCDPNGPVFIDGASCSAQKGSDWEGTVTCNDDCTVNTSMCTGGECDSNNPCCGAKSCVNGFCEKPEMGDCEVWDPETCQPKPAEDGTTCGDFGECGVNTCQEGSCTGQKLVDSECTQEGCLNSCTSGGVCDYNDDASCNPGVSCGVGGTCDSESGQCEPNHPCCGNQIDDASCGQCCNNKYCGGGNGCDEQIS